jgi:hypothetical protein
MEILLKGIPAIMEGMPVERFEPCRICNETIGKKLAVIDFWDIKTSNLIKCTQCGHIQLDPMLSDVETSKGCLAYYIESTLRTSAHGRSKNCLRNFRRGVVFGYSLNQIGDYCVKGLSYK